MKLLIRVLFVLVIHICHESNAQTIKSYMSFKDLAPTYPISFDQDGNKWVATQRAGLLMYNDTVWQNYTQTDGLPSNRIIGIAHDSNGSTWALSRRGGVSKFENNHWTNFNIQDSVPRQALTSIAADKYGNIWVGSVGGGIWMSNGKNTYIHTTDDGLAENVIKSIVTDSNGDIWVVSERDSLSKFTGSGWINYSIPESLKGSSGTIVVPDLQGQIWFAKSDGRIMAFDGKEWQQPIDPTDFRISTITALQFDGDNNLWIAAHIDNLNKEEIIKYDGSAWTSLYPKIGSFWNIKSIEIDEKGRLLWIANSGSGGFRGLMEFDGEQVNHIEIKIGLPDAFVKNIKSDNCGNIWFETSQGIAKYDGHIWEYPDLEKRSASYNNLIINEKNNFLFGQLAYWILQRCPDNWTDHSGLKIPPHFPVYAVAKDLDNHFWFLTNQGLAKYDGDKWIIHGNLKVLPRSTFLNKSMGYKHLNSKGIDTLRISHNGNVLQEYHIIEDFPDEVFTIAVDSSANIWLGVRNGGVIKYDGTDWINFKSEDGLPSDHVNVMTVDLDGCLWVGTDRGLARCIGDEWTSFINVKGLDSNHITAISPDESGNLWIGTTTGLSKYDGFKFTNIWDKNLPEIKNIHFINIDSNNCVWIVTSSGVFKISTP